MEPDGKIDPIKLEEWIDKARLDPNDPENEDLLTRTRNEMFSDKTFKKYN